MLDCKTALYTEDQKKNIFQLLNFSESELNENVKNILEWVKTQPHIPETPESVVIEKFLIMNKLRVDKVKERISLYYVIRSIMPEIFNISPNSTEFLKIKKSFDFAILQELASDLSRIIVFRVRDELSEIFDPMMCITYVMLVSEIRLREEYRLRDVLVYDMKNVSMANLTKLTPIQFKKISLILKKLYNDNGTYINLINVSSFANSFVGMLKSFHPKKIQDRFTVHDSLESLYKVVPRNSLPCEYGGNAGTLEEVSDWWTRKLVEYEPILSHLRNIKINTDLLPENLKIDDHFGVHGNFKKLDVD